MEIYAVDKPFPGPIPPREGSILEMGADGDLFIIMQFPNLKRSELEGFKRGFENYSYFESSTPVPIAIWIFGFTRSFGLISTNFDARLYKDDRVQRFLDSDQDLMKFFLVDGEILKGIKLITLQTEAIDLFKKTLIKQLDMAYTPDEYARYMTAIYEFSDSELMQLGFNFQMKKKG